MWPEKGGKRLIRLICGLALDADEYSFIVGKSRQRPGRGTILDRPRYYPSISQAAQGALEQALRQGVAVGEITTLGQFVQEQERLHRELEVLLTILEPEGAAKPRQTVADTRKGFSEGKAISQQKSVSATARGL